MHFHINGSHLQCNFWIISARFNDLIDLELRRNLIYVQYNCLKTFSIDICTLNVLNNLI